MKSKRMSAYSLALSIVLTLLAAVACKKPGTTKGPEASPTPDYIPGRFELGVCIHGNDTDQVGIMKDMGAKWVRIDIEWCELEVESGTVNWGVVDNAVNNAKKHGMQVYAHIQCTPEFAVKNGQKPWSGVPKREYWTSFVERVAKRYHGKISALGIWNEPNLKFFWTGSARDYAEELVKPAAPVIRANAPGMLVVGPDLSHLYKGDLDMQDFYNTLKQTGAVNELDVISHHVYGHEDFENNMMGYPGVIPVKSGFREILDKAGITGKRIWITEFGVDSAKTGEAGQSEFLYNQIQKMSGWGWIEKAFVYEIYDGDMTVNWRYGLLRNDGSPKPAVQTIKDILNP